MLMQIILVKRTLYVKEKCKKKKNHFISWQNSGKIKKAPKKSNNFHPVLAESTASPCSTIIGL